MKRLIPIAVLVALGGALYWYYNRPITTITLTGVVTTNDIIVSPQIGGRISQLDVKEGDTVKRGQIVAVIAPDELRAESAYAAHNVESVVSQMQQAQAALRFEERQMEEQVRQAEATLAAAEAEQAAAAADLQAARLNLQRVQNLSREGVAAARELDEAKTRVDVNEARLDALKRQTDAQRAAIALARANVEQVAQKRSLVQTNRYMQEAAAAQQAKADVRLAYTDVTAPIDGIVDVRAARVGEVVNPGQPIVTILNPDDYWIRADIEETYIDRVKVGDHFKVRLPSGAELDGEVIYRGADASFATQRDVSRTKRDIKTFEIRLRSDNKERRLAVGMTAYVDIPVQAIQ
jgi:HlyD family secretion protein